MIFIPLLSYELLGANKCLYCYAIHINSSITIYIWNIKSRFMHLCTYNLYPKQHWSLMENMANHLSHCKINQQEFQAKR